MKITMKLLPRMKLSEFADKYGLEMVVNERDTSDITERFTARFRQVEIMLNGCLLSAVGVGRSPLDAIRDYASQISRTKIAVAAYTPHRINIDVPLLSTGTEKL